MDLEVDGTCRGHGVEPYDMGTDILVDLNDSTRAEDRMQHPLPRHVDAASKPCDHLSVLALDMPFGPAYESFVRLMRELEKRPVYLEKETGRVADRAVEAEAVSLAEVKRLLCPGDGHEGKPALLLHPLRGAYLSRGEDAFVHRAQEDIRELDPLGRMDRYETHLVASVLGIRIGQLPLP